MKKKKIFKFILSFVLVLSLIFGFSLFNKNVSAQTDITEETYIELPEYFIIDDLSSFESSLNFSIQFAETSIYNGIYIYNNNTTITIYYSSIQGQKVVYQNGWLSNSYRFLKILPTEYNSESESAINFIESYGIFDRVLIPSNMIYTFNVGTNADIDFGLNINFYTSYIVPSNLLFGDNALNYARKNFNRISYSGEQDEVSYSYISQQGTSGFFAKPNESEWLSNYRTITFIGNEIISSEDYEILLNIGIFGIYQGDNIIIDNDNVQAQVGFKDLGALVITITQAPVNFLSQFLDVNVLGINLFAIVSFIVTISIVIFVIKRVL